MLIKLIKSQKGIAGGAFPPIIIIPIITLIQRSKLMFFSDDPSDTVLRKLLLCRLLT